MIKIFFEGDQRHVFFLLLNLLDAFHFKQGIVLVLGLFALKVLADPDAFRLDSVCPDALPVIQCLTHVAL